MSAPSAGWYLRRMRRMSAAELGHRLGDAARRQAWARRHVLPDAVPVLPPDLLPGRQFGSPLPAAARDAVPAEAAAAAVAAADRVLAGTWSVLGVSRPDSADPDWFADPVTGVRAPDQRLAFEVHHRDEAETGNVKQVWEMSRHHQVSVLAAAFWLTGQERYAETAAAQLRSWWAANPFLSGVHWTSGIEAGVRLLCWVWVRRLLADWPKVGDLFEDDEDALRQIGWHQEFLAGFVSRGSSANNHVVAEAAGRLAAACAFPWYARSERWRQDAAALLERELAANTFPDGMNREQASDYHRFVLELALVAAVEADAAGSPLPDTSWQLLARMADAGVAVLDVAGRPPRQGDGDEGRGLVLDDPDRDPWAVALGTAGAVLGTPDWWPQLAGSVQAASLGALARPRALPRPAERPDRFEDAGLMVLRSLPEDGPELWCRVDGGPHGFLSIAAHGHADALSVEVRHDGVELLVDPGTYCYHGEPHWRQYFRGTAAHNTLQLSGEDQSVSGGPFLWTSHARSTILSCEVGERPVQTWVAQHDGYRRLKPAAVHRRSVTLDSPGRTLTVVDRVQVRGRLPVQLSWHLGPDVEVELAGDEASLTWQHGGGLRSALLRLPGELSWTAHNGEQDPICGWYSPGFGRRVPSTTLLGDGVGITAMSLITTLCLL